MDIVTGSLHGSPWRAFAHRNFALFLTGHGLSLCGTWMQSMAQAWLIYRLTGSPWLLGVAEFLARGPVLVFGLLGGVFADRWPRRRLLLVAQGLLMVHAIALAVLTLGGWVTVEWVLALALCLGLISAIEVPVRQTFLTDLVPKSDIASAIGLNSSVFNTARIIGPSIAGLVVGLFGEGVCFAVNAASFLLVLGCLAAIRVEPAVRPREQNAIRLLREGVAYAWHTPHVRVSLALVGVVSIAGMPFATLLPVFAGSILRSGPDGLGLLMAATGIGALMAALRLARRRTMEGMDRFIAQAGVLFSLGLLALALSETFWLSMAALLVVGFGMVSGLAGVNTLLQTLAPEPLRGRVVSLYATGSLGLTIFGSLLAGAGASYIGAPATVAAGGVLTLAAVLWFWRTEGALVAPPTLEGTVQAEPEAVLPRSATKAV